MKVDLTDWYEEHRRKRVADFRAKRPALLRHEGNLHDDVAGWGSRLFDKTAGNLILMGPTGTSKTWHTWEVMERALAYGYAGTILMLSQAEWQETIGPPADRDMLRAMREADVLALDDLGSQRLNDWTRELLLPVIDARWANAQPTMVTSNLADLDEQLGERISSRLAHHCTVVDLDGKDLRASA
ncbi:ATP-binding protein [Nonomuraea sp. NPDC050790]|uniref:ATP-binding protein n=1 Tax=Nonomuraea sp. NPDC050790 TaxID=3364371 RepID=UPI0037A43E27